MNKAFFFSFFKIILNSGQGTVVTLDKSFWKAIDNMYQVPIIPFMGKDPRKESKPQTLKT